MIAYCKGLYFEFGTVNLYSIYSKSTKCFCKKANKENLKKERREAKKRDRKKTDESMIF